MIKEHATEEIIEKVNNTPFKKVIPEEDWYEIQTRGYDIEMMRHNADNEHPEWRDVIEDALDEAQDEEGFLVVFFRGFDIGTSGAEVEEMTWNW